MSEQTPPVREEELAALADGTLPAARQQAVLQAIEADPALAAAFAAQQRAVDAVRLANTHIEAPHSLRVRVSELSVSAPAPARRRLTSWVAAMMFTGAAVVTAAAVFGVLRDKPSTLTFADTASLAGQPSFRNKPVTGGPKILAIDAEGVAFPDYAAKFGWEAIGSRVDTVAGRTVTTVTYRKDGVMFGYAIVSGAPLPVPDGGRVVTQEGTPITVVNVAGGSVVTWQRKGHTCVIVGDRVPEATLVELAGWKGKGAIDFAQLPRMRGPSA